MVIVFVVDNFTSKTDGTNISAQRFREELIRQGHEVRVLAIGVEGEGMYSLKEKYIPIVTPVSKKSNMRFAKFDKKVTEKALDGADAVHLFFPWKFQQKVLKMAKKKGITTTAAFHLHPENITYNIGLKKFTFIAEILFRAFRHNLYKKVDNIHCPSKFTADELEKRKYKARLHVISNGVSRKFYLADEKTKRDDDTINILMTGRLSSEKRQDLVIKAALLSKYKDRIQLFFAGKGPKEKHYMKLGEKLPLAPNFEFVPQDKLIEILKKADIYVHAADIEIEGISCIEAISTGTVPIISNSKKSATPQFALSDKSLFKSGDYKDLSKKIDYLIENEEERNQLSKAYIVAGKYYDIEHTARTVESFFKASILDQKTKHLIESDKDLKKFIRAAKPKKTVTKAFKAIFYYLIAVPVLFLINKIWFGLKIEGRKNIRKIRKNGGITVCNHIHYLDSAICALGVYPKKPIFTSLPSNLDPSVIGVLTRLLGATPIPSNMKETRAFFHALSQSTRSGKFVHFYPEGELVLYDEKIRDFKRGAFYLAVDSKKPIIPMRINYREPNKLRKLVKQKTPCLTLVIGEPIYHNFLLEKPKAVDDLQKKSEAMMQKLVIESEQ